MSLLSYHKSINSEIVAMRNRVRDLLHPGIHWGEDGKHKEAILYQALSRHLPKSIHLSSGFVRLRNSSTSQIDLMITNSSGPILFRENEFQIVTPNLVEAIIEVKTKVTLSQLETALVKLSDNATKIREERQSDEWASMNFPSSSITPWAGLFVYEECDIKPQAVVDLLKRIANQRVIKAIHSICLGPNVFIRLWTTNPIQSVGTSVFHPSWHYYELDGLAFSYFLGNALWMHEDGSPEQRHWFPLIGGKEPFLKAKASMEPPYD